MRETVYHLATTLDAIFDGVIVTDRDGLITRLNPAAEALTGWTTKEALHRPVRDVLCLHDSTPGSCHCDQASQALQGGKPIHLDSKMLMRTRKGRILPIAGSIAPIKRPDGVILGAVIVFRDRTGEEAQQREIERRERLLQTILDTLPMSVMLKDAAGRYVFANEDFTRRLGKSREQILGLTTHDVFPPEFADARSKHDARVLAEGGHVVREGYAPAGTFPGYWLSGATRLDLGPDAEPLLLRYAMDITSRRKTEEALRESNQTLEVFFSQSLEGIFIMLLDEPMVWNDATDKQQAVERILTTLRVTRCNDAVLQQYGGSREQFMGMTMAQGFRHDLAQARKILMHVFSAGRVRMEVEGRRFDGGVVWIEGDYIVLRNDAGLVTGLFGAQRDINERKRAEQSLLASAERFRATFDQAAVGIGHLDREGRWLRVNDRLCSIAGLAAEDMRQMTLLQLIHPADQASASGKISALMAGELEAVTLEQRFQRSSGSIVWVALTLSVVRQIAGEDLHAVAVVQDITKRKRSEALLTASEERFRDVVDAAGEYIWETDAEWRIVFISNQIERVMGYSPAELIGHQTMEFLPEDEAIRVEHLFRNRKNRAAPFNAIELQALNSAGERVWQQMSGVPVLDDLGQIIGYRGASLNINDRKLAEQKIEQLATKDSLTGLPNRLLLNDRLEQAIANAQRKEEMLALMFIDLDRFKTINDSLGHHVGDMLLKSVADRLNGCVRRGDTLARLGGDEFIIALYNLKAIDDVTQIARKILSTVSHPCQIEGHMLSSGCSIGIGIYPSDGADVQTLMRNADTAMYHAKEKGRNNYQFFSPEMNIRAVERLHLENELRLAVQNQQFTLEYQPQIDMRSNEITGAEALIRWVHPRTGERVPPARFISVAEDTGLIVPIGEWVLRTACAQAKAWQRAGHPDLRMTVNVSVGQFRGNVSLVETLERVLSETGLAAQHLELEMTESLLFQNIEENLKLLNRIGDMGVRISIDDFGTGYSSLSYLKQLPVDTIKIDGSFVRDIVTDESDAAIIAAIIAMARRLKLGVIAEGVETLEQLNALRELQCDEYQGFYFSKALPAEEFEREFFGEPRQRQVS